MQFHPLRRCFKWEYRQIGRPPACKQNDAGSLKAWALDGVAGPAVPVPGASSNGRMFVLHTYGAGSSPAAPITLLWRNGSAAVS